MSTTAVGFTAKDPPDKRKPGGRTTRYQPVIDEAKAHPGKWYELEGEHHSSNIHTLKSHGLAVRSQKGTEKHKHLLWVCFEPHYPTSEK